MRVTVGRVIGAHGVRGDVVVRVAGVGSVLESARSAYVAGQAVQILASRTAGVGRIILRLEGFGNRDRALSLKGAEVAVLREQLPPVAEGEFYRCDVVGLRVRIENAREIGHVTDVIETGANDVFVVTGDDGREVLVPAIADVVVGIDLRAGWITIRAMPGLLDD